MARIGRAMLWWVGIAILMLLVFTWYQQNGSNIAAAAYSAFKTQIAANPAKFTKVLIGDGVATATMTDNTKEIVNTPQGKSDELQLLDKYHIVYSFDNSASNTLVLQVLFGAIPVIVLIAIIFFFLRQAQSGGSQAR